MPDFENYWKNWEKFQKGDYSKNGGPEPKIVWFQVIGSGKVRLSCHQNNLGVNHAFFWQ